jgi:hypothetical protein
MTQAAPDLAKLRVTSDINPIRHRLALHDGSGRPTVPRTLLTAMIGLARSAGVTDTCLNAVQHADNYFTGPPERRASEMVRSLYKEGSGVDEQRFSDDGIVSYVSTGNFADGSLGFVNNLYHVAPSVAGWITAAPSPPGVTYDTGGGTAAAGSADLRPSLWVMCRRDSSAIGDDICLHSPADDSVHVGRGATTECSCPSPGVVGTSTDLSHVLFQYGSAGSAIVTGLREYVGVGNGGLPRAVSVDNDGNPTPAETCPNGISNDGRVIVFASGCHVATPQQVWARVAGSATIAVSGPECTRSPDDLNGACNDLSSTAYVNAAKNGLRVFFTTTQQLVNGDINAASDLCACDIPPGSPARQGLADPCASLTEVSGPARNAQVANVEALSDDGSRVYCVAQGVLANNLGVGVGVGGGDHGAVADEHNMSLWKRHTDHPAEHNRFVAGHDASNLTQVRMIPDGRYLTFLRSNALMTTGPAADNDHGARDVHRYDAATRTVVRVSTSTSGNRGNETQAGAVLDGGGSGVFGSMTADGGRIAFDTTEALSPSDNGVSDEYLWHDGQVSVISSRGADLLRISPVTRQPGETGIEAVTAMLPLGLALDPNNADSDSLCEHIDGPEDECPAKSVTGTVTANSSLVKTPLTGKVSVAKGVRTDPKMSGQIRTYPALLIKRRGEINMKLRATNSVLDSKHWTSTFQAIPDAPISSFSMELNSGKKKGILGIVDGNNNICSVPQKRILAAQAHNGKRLDAATTVTVESSLAIAFTHTNAKPKSEPFGASHARRAVASGVKGRSLPASSRPVSQSSRSREI